jgi:hypothetical protein
MPLGVRKAYFGAVWRPNDEVLNQGLRWLGEIRPFGKLVALFWILDDVQMGYFCVFTLKHSVE